MNTNGIEIDFHTTPQLWVAVREGQCGCLDCRGKFPMGTGKTPVIALADLLEQEMEREPA